MEMVKSLGMTMVYFLGLACIYHSLVDFQLGVKSDSIPLQDICTKSAKCHTCFRSSGRNLIINVHCPGESAPQVGAFINDLKCLSAHSDGWFAVRLPGAGWYTILLYCLC